MGNTNIVIIGFMATGKTTIGKIISNNLDFEFIDTDQLIEKAENMTINDIFNLKGEVYFRKKEKEVLNSLIYIQNKIISTGGGIIISEENRIKLKLLGKVVYLQASPKWILSNLNKDNGNRPLLQNEKEPINKINQLLKERIKYYEQIAEVTIKVDQRTPEDIASNIISLVYSLD